MTSETDPSAARVQTASQAVQPAREEAAYRRYWRRARVIMRWLLPVTVLVFYVVYALRELASHRYQINPDGVSYITIARQYSQGHFWDAVSAYWSPLYSWLMVLPLWGGADEMLAGKIAGIGAGAIAVVGLMYLLKGIGASLEIRLILTASAVPLIVESVYAVTTPDLLLGAVLLLYLGAWCGRRPRAGSRTWKGDVGVGLLGGLAYLAKAYALPVVTAHILLLGGLSLIFNRHQWRRVLFQYGRIIASLGVIVGLWAAVLSYKNGFVTWGSTGAYNLKIDARNSPGQAMYLTGFVAPPSATSLSAWDDITPYGKLLPPRKFFASSEDWEFTKAQIARNYQELVKVLDQVSPALWWIAVLLFLTASSRADRLIMRCDGRVNEPEPVDGLQKRPVAGSLNGIISPGIILGLFALFYTSGYMLLHIEQRFIVPLILILIAGGGYLIAIAGHGGLLSGWLRRGLVAAALGYTLIGWPIQNLDKTRDSGRYFVELSQGLDEVLPAGLHVASDGSWGWSLYLSFHRGLHYYGQPIARTSERAMLSQLDALGVPYLLVWNSKLRVPADAGWSQVPLPVKKPFRLYHRDAASAE